MTKPTRGPDQRVRIHRAEEKDIAKAATRVGVGEAITEGIPRRPLVADSGPLRVQGWWENELVFIQPLTIKDGRVEDLNYTPTEAIRIDRLVFIYGGRGYLHRLGLVQVAAHQPLHLALNHLALTDKFGANVLGH